MTESELYKELGMLTKNKEDWEQSIPYISTLLESDSNKIKAKALWLLGEMGLAYPYAVTEYLPKISSFLDSSVSLLRERAINALGRIGRADFKSIKPYWHGLFRFAHDPEANVRLSFIWASENIATNTPDPYNEHMPIFAELLHDSNDRIRMEAPEIFRVLGKRRPAMVQPYIEVLTVLSNTDDNKVVRIHSLGAIKATQCERQAGHKVR